VNPADLNHHTLERPPTPEGRPVRLQTGFEELVNSVSHGLGLVVILTAGPYLIADRSFDGSTASVWGALIFTLTAIFLYLASTTYHTLPPGPSKQRLDRIDHAAIYFLIAGTYTPFALTVLRGPLGWTLLAVIWAMALVGAYLKLVHGITRRKLSTVLYLVMGWLGLVAIRPLYAQIGTDGLYWLIAGGLAYTLGVIFYSLKRVPFTHCIWHLFVLAGTACHYLAIFRYAK